jgi:hypothetical protein
MGAWCAETGPLAADRHAGPARRQPQITEARLRPARGPSLPASLLTADAALNQALGTGIDGIGAVLGTAVTWTSGADDVTDEDDRDVALGGGP